MPPTELLQESRDTAARTQGLYLDKRDSAILKALAIVSIVFHNFFHVVSPAQQNEFTFNSVRFAVFLHTLRHPELATQALFSFFGHFGVQVFIFLSAYGLTRSHCDPKERWITFMTGRLSKLYPVFGLIVIPWFLVFSFQDGIWTVVRSIGIHLVLMFLGASTLIPGFGLPPVGPWWFIPFIVQFYAIWPLMRRFACRFGVGGLIVLPILAVAFVQMLNPVLARWEINLLTTPIGRMPSICIGILAARYGLRIPGWLAAIALPTLLLGSMYEGFWRLAGCAALVLCLWSYLRMRNILRHQAWLERLGQYSLIIFLVNGIVRDLLVPIAATPALQIALAAADLLISVAIAAILHPFVTSNFQMHSAPSQA